MINKRTDNGNQCATCFLQRNAICLQNKIREKFFENLTKGRQGDKAEKIAQIIINFQIFPFIYKFIFHGL